MLIIFDLDDTLIDTSGCITPIKLKAALQRMMESGLSIPDFNVAFEQLMQIDRLKESGRATLEEFLRAHPVFLEIGLKELYETSCEKIPVASTPDTLELLQELKRSHTLALVTIGERDQQMQKMKNAGIDFLLFSKIVVCARPNKGLHYEAIATELGYPASEVVVCGDRIITDLSPAKALGFKTVHVLWGRGRNSVGPKQDVDHTISTVAQLKNTFIRCTS